MFFIESLCLKFKFINFIIKYNYLKNNQIIKMDKMKNIIIILNNYYY